MKIAYRNLPWLMLAISVVGCAQWSTPPSSELGRLSLPKLAPDSVVLEVTFVRIPDEQVQFADRFWPEVDEAVFATDVRRHMKTNGFRCGLIGTPPPPALQEVLDLQELASPDGQGTKIAFGTEVIARTHRMRSRAGQPGKIIVRSDPVQNLAALTLDENGRIRGDSLDQAQFYVAITSHARGDGRVLLELQPVIEYGFAQPRFKGRQGVWMIDNTSRQTKAYEDLKIQAELSPGQSIAVGCTPVERGLGAQFFGADHESKTPRLLLVVRLQQTQRDVRFDEDETAQPVATVTD